MTRFLNRRCRRHGRCQSGFSVLELTITAMMMGLIGAAILSVLVSTSRNEKLQQSLVGNQELVRFGMTKVARDLRSANPVEPNATIGDYATKFEVALGPSAGTQQYVRWWLSGKTLFRSKITTPGGSIISSETVLTNVENATQGTTLFRYYDAHANELATSGVAPAAVGDITNCAIRVRVTVSSDAFPGPVPFSEQSDTELRNRLPGGPGC